MLLTFWFKFSVIRRSNRGEKCKRDVIDCFCCEIRVTIITHNFRANDDNHWTNTSVYGMNESISQNQLIILFCCCCFISVPYIVRRAFVKYPISWLVALYHLIHSIHAIVVYMNIYVYFALNDMEHVCQRCWTFCEPYSKTQVLSNDFLIAHKRSRQSSRRISCSRVSANWL